MADTLRLQQDDPGETPGDEKGSFVSYFLCYRSNQSLFCLWS